jgi:carbamoyltransferase
MRRGQTALDWSVYSGPRLDLRPPRDWSARSCGDAAVARILHEEHEPVAVLAGRAELGPRALGNRSTLAPATEPAIKDRLNAAKDRAGYRPVGTRVSRVAGEESVRPRRR